MQGAEELRDLVTQFESLGGTGHGCEFGIFQRHFGAEPLGLLRWADLGHDLLTAALIDRFTGVGTERQTEIFVPADGGHNEYWTRDRKYWMAMRTFIPQDRMSPRRVRETILRRLSFLRLKIIADLEQSSKIFVYKNMLRNLTDQELARLHRAVTLYNHANTLLYIRYADLDHPNGTVEARPGGLLVGYIDHFSFSPNDEKLGEPTDDLLLICRNALTALAAAVPTSASAPAEPPLSIDGGLAEADAAAGRGDIETALTLWAHLRAQHPGHSAAYLRAVALLDRLGRQDETEPLFAEGVRSCPTDSSLAIGYAARAHHRGDYDTALTRWAVAVQRFPDDLRAQSGKAASLVALGRIAEAEALLTAASEQHPDDPSPLIERASLAERRRDWTAAAAMWAELRTRVPDQVIGYRRGAAALREAGRLQEADQLLVAGAARFPDNAEIAAEACWLAQHSGRAADAAARWEAFRARFPDRIVAYTGAAAALRELRRFGEAEALLRAASERFPNDPAPLFDMAALAARQARPGAAVERWQVAGQRFPKLLAPLLGQAIALRDQRRFDEAEAVLNKAAERFPDDHGPPLELAWLAFARRDWVTALARWRTMAERLPDRAEVQLRVAMVLSELMRYDDAEHALKDAMQRFPDAAALTAEHAWIAYRSNRYEDAAARFSALRERFPAEVEGYLGGGMVLRALFRLTEADALFEAAIARFPGHPQLRLEYALVPVAPVFKRDKNWDAAIARFMSLREAFPDFERGHLAAIRTLIDAGKTADAEAWASAAATQVPDSPGIAVAYGEAALDRGDATQAVLRLRAAVARFPDHDGAVAALAGALSRTGQHDEAETVLAQARARLPNSAAIAGAFARAAMERRDWAAALDRWEAAYRLFPDEKTFAHRAFDARMRLIEQDTPATTPVATTAAPAGATAAADNREVFRELLLQFESLGGRGLGCEFGIFQRDYGAEPLGLLRWADMPPDKLVEMLENEFDGVGLPENTMMFVDRDHGRPEYCTQDRRGMMFMRTFTAEDEVPFDAMWSRALKRLQYLRRKLLADLRAAEKIFVYRITPRNLTADELDRIHRGVRRYGNATLLYVRYEDAEHPSGTVEIAAPGLMIGYMDRFKETRDGQLTAAPANASWARVCERAYGLWRAGTTAAAMSCPVGAAP